MDRELGGDEKKGYIIKTGKPVCGSVSIDSKISYNLGSTIYASLFVG